MFHIPHNVFTSEAYPVHMSSNHIQQSRRRSAALDNQFLRHTLADDLVGARRVTTVADPAEQARERLLLAIEEQKAARKAYADLVAERELARLEAAAAQPDLAILDFHELSAPESFELDYGLLLQRQQQRAALQQQQREQAIIRQRQEEFVRVQRQKAAEEAALRRKQEHEAAHLQQLAALREQKLEAIRQQKLVAHRRQQLEALRQHQLAAVRRQQEAEQQRRQQIVEEARRQYQLEEVRRQYQLHHRQEAARRHPAEQHQQGPSATDGVSQAIALAIAVAQQFFSDESKEPEKSAKPASAPTPVELARRVRFAGAPNTVTPTAPVPSSSKPASVPVARTATSSTTPAIRINIRDTKGKAAAHVRVNSSPAPAPSSPTTTTSPADAVAALTILASDLDSYLAPEHEWHSEAHRRHALSQLLEQIDAVESGGEENVRDVRRALVRRVERALEGLPEEEVASKAKGIVISEPTAEVTPAIVATAAAPIITPVAVAEIEGYDVPDFLEATPDVSATTTEDSPAIPAAPALSTDLALPETTPQSTVQSEWSTVDPTVSTALSSAIAFPDDDVEAILPASEATINAPQLNPGEPTPTNAPQLDLGEPAPVQSSQNTATEIDDGIIDAFETVDVVSAKADVSTAVSPAVKHDGLSDWETTGSDVEQ